MYIQKILLLIQCKEWILNIEINFLWYSSFQICLLLFEIYQFIFNKRSQNILN